MNLDYRKLTVFNYQMAYYFFRIFTFVWLWDQVQLYKIRAARPAEFYAPKVWIEKLIFPEFPSPVYFGFFCVVLVLSLLWSLLKPTYIANFLIFLSVAVINLPISGYISMSHTNHVLILFYFFSIFLLPTGLKESDYRYVQYIYLGLLGTYSLAGFWKLGSVAKHIVKGAPEVSWMDPNAAWYNTLWNYYTVDVPVPEWMVQLYQFPHIWVIVTLTGIVFQFLCFLGAFSRKYLTFTLMFLLVFHYYTKYFVLADLYIMKIGLIFLFFPYHWFYRGLRSRLAFLNLI